jgi:hypothetical protein
MRRSDNTLRWGSAAVFAVLAIAELAHMLLRGPWVGFTTGSHPVSGLLVALWGATAVGLALFHRWAWIAAAFGSVAAMGHGAVLRLSFNLGGLFYLLLGAVAFILVIAEHRQFGFTAKGTSRDSFPGSRPSYS